LLLTAAKFLVPIDRAFRNHDWEPRYGSNPSLLLDGKTCLILGLGHIGQRVALVCQALGMQVLGIRRNPGAPILPGLRMDVYPPEDLHQLLPRAEALIITLPLTSETENMIGENELELLPSGGLLVNVGRGKIVDQAALYHTLKDGRLAAAGLDVWYNYPQAQAERRSTPPADYPFHELDNLVMSPHRGGGSLESEKHRMESLAELINFASQNKSIPNRVDIEAGY
jgi:phosphoglycerate dehydrogenase-like enzyme